MPDITMCDNKTCPLRKLCYRFKAIPFEYWQAFAHFEPKNDKECDYFWDIKYVPPERLNNEQK